MSFLVGAVAFLCLIPFDVSGIRRFEVYHAAPYVLLMLLSGQSPPYPEVSTLSGWAPGFVSLSGKGNFGGVHGRFMVNPMDNSIWFIPLRGGS